MGAPGIQYVPATTCSKTTFPYIPLPPKSAPLPCGAASTLRWLESKLIASLPVFSFLFMAYSSVTAIYESRGDPSTVAFVLSSLSILAGLYCCMREYERTRREWLKLAILLLALALNAIFSYRVTSVIGSAVFSMVIWGIAAVTTAIGCCLVCFLRVSDSAVEPL